MQVMLNVIRQHKTKTRKAFLMAKQIEELESKIKELLKDEDEDIKGYEGTLKKTVKGKPNALQHEMIENIKEIKELRSGKLSKYIDAPKTKNTTKTKK